MKIYVFDLDGTLCVTNKHMDGHWEYKTARPFPDRISRVNQLFDSGNRIIIETARGSNSREDWTNFTKEQIIGWGLKFHELRAGTKYAADYYIDDRSINSEEFFSGGNLNIN